MKRITAAKAASLKRQHAKLIKAGQLNNTIIASGIADCSQLIDAIEVQAIDIENQLATNQLYDELVTYKPVTNGLQ